MEITDLMSKEEWARLEEEFHHKTGLDTNVYDQEGYTFTGLKQWANRVCPVIKAKPESLQAVCSVAHQNLAHQARTLGEPVIEECDIGLLKICVPVIVNGRFLGAVGGCGHLLEDGEVDTFLVHKLTGRDEAEVEELASDLKRISAAQARSVAQELERRVKDLSGGLQG